MEKHHITPRCLGGDNQPENLIYLFPQEHFYAHKLLYEENSHNRKLSFAYYMMSGLIKKKYSEEDWADEYAKARESFTQNFNSGENHYLYGKKIPTETLKKMIASHTYIKGEGNPWWGRKHSEESKQKMSKSRKGVVYPNSVKALQEYREKIGHSAFKGHTHSTEAIEQNAYKHQRPVVCITTGEIFDSIEIAAKAVGLKSPSPVGEACKYPSRHAGRKNGEQLSWRYATLEDFDEDNIPYYFTKEKSYESAEKI